MISTNYLGFEDRNSQEMHETMKKRNSTHGTNFKDYTSGFHLKNNMTQLFSSAEQIYGDKNSQVEADF